MCTLRLSFALCLALSASVAAQPSPLPDTLRWELVGSRIPVGRDTTGSTYGIGFLSDTLLASTVDGVFQLAPGAADWALVGRPRQPSGTVATFPAADGHVAFIDETATDLSRSADGGRSWDVAVRDATVLPTWLPDGSLIVGTNTFGNGAPSVLRSTDDGETWAVYGEYAGLYPYAFAVLPPGAEHAETRLVAADAFGLVYSADAGPTWAVVEEFQDRIRCRTAYAVPRGRRDGGHSGRVLIGCYEFGGNRSVVLASDDGGRTWSEVFEHPRSGSLMRLFGAPDGAVYAFSSQNNEDTRLFGSDDGGQTWRDLGRIEATWPEGDRPAGVPSWVPPGGPWSDWPFGASQFAFGPDGRLYVGGVPAQQVDYDDPGGGVLRTVEPVVAVAAELAEPEAPGLLSVRAFPNPASGSVTVALEGIVLGEAVRVVVYDALGREVAELHDGPSPSGSSFSLDAARLPPGLYLIRAVGDGGFAYGRLAVVH